MRRRLFVKPNLTSGDTTAFQGTVAGSGGQTGTLTVTVQSVLAASSASLFHFPFVATLHAQTSGTVAATGSLHIGGGSTTSLTGTYNPSTKALSVTGGGFTLTGTFGSGVVSGTYTGPNSVTGGFSTLSTTSGTVTVYCGTFHGGQGVFNIEVSAIGGVSGVASLGNQVVNNIGGQVSGTTITLTHTDGLSGTATGTIQNGTVTGTDSGGPWSGSTSACQ